MAPWELENGREVEPVYDQCAHYFFPWRDTLVKCMKCGAVTMSTMKPETVEMRAVKPSVDDPAIAEAVHALRGEHKDDGKPAVQYLEPEFLEAIGRAMGFGAKKYAERNYRKGIAQSRLVASVLRHVFAWMRKEDIDPESGLPHLAHAGASLNMLFWTTVHKPELDDR